MTAMAPGREDAAAFLHRPVGESPLPEPSPASAAGGQRPTGIHEEPRNAGGGLRAPPASVETLAGQRGDTGFYAPRLHGCYRSVKKARRYPQRLELVVVRAAKIRDLTRIRRRTYKDPFTTGVLVTRIRSRRPSERSAQTCHKTRHRSKAFHSASLGREASSHL